MNVFCFTTGVEALGCRDEGLRLRVKGLRVQGLGFRVEGLGLRVQGLRVQGLGFRVEGLGLRVQGLRVQGLGLGFRDEPQVSKPYNPRPEARKTSLHSQNPQPQNQYCKGLNKCITICGCLKAAIRCIDAFGYSATSNCGESNGNTHAK